MKFENSRHVPVLDGAALADEIRRHHVYLTAARHEPGGNHYIEGMCCGLPVLYLESGSLPEYCAPYGFSFTLNDFDQRLMEMRERYPALREAVLECPYGAGRMAKWYLGLFEALVRERRVRPQLGNSSDPLNPGKSSRLASIVQKGFKRLVGGV